MYRLKYLPIARQDIIDIARYISHDLSNPAAAEKLAVELVGAAENLAIHPYIHSVFRPVRPLKKEYRKIGVKNYLMFYWVEEAEKIVTIARIIYARRDYEKLL